MLTLTVWRDQNTLALTRMVLVCKIEDVYFKVNMLDKITVKFIVNIEVTKIFSS